MSFSVQSIPRPAAPKPRVITPSKEDLVKQAKYTGTRYKRLRCAVTVRSDVARVAVPGGYVLPPGTHEIVIDDYEMESLEDLLEKHPEEIAAASREYEKHLREMVDEKKNGSEWRQAGVPDADVQAEMKLADKETGESLQSFFYRRTGLSIMPITKIELLGELAPIDLDTDANPAVVGAIAAGVAREIVTAMQAQAAPQQGNNNKR